MIFPSARCDISCEFLNGELTDFTGFNFVDYRDLDRPLSKFYLDASNWANTFFEGVTIHTAPADSPYAHSWRMEGKESAEDSNRERWMKKLYEKKDS